LESVCGETHRGFESHLLRKERQLRTASLWSVGETEVFG
jgi:hypothetical protein